MANKVDVAQIRGQLVDAVKQGDEPRARVLVPQLGPGPRHVRVVLEAMLEDPDALVRQAAAFGLGELSGATSVRCLEQQLAIEEARGDYDGEAVVEEIVRALSRIEDAGARASLVRKLDRLAAGRPERSDVNEVAHALWKKRHPELLPVVRRSFEQLSLPEPNTLHGLLVLLEKSPVELGAWALDSAVPVRHKTGVLMLLEEQLPDSLISAFPKFISAASALIRPALNQRGEAAYFCEVLLNALLMHRERLLIALPEAVRAELRHVARSLVASKAMGCALRAASVLEFVGRPEDATELETHRPADPTFAKVFDDVVRALRSLH
ncbi:HEAT repeat domain-containing protein [Hyalangium sp.]|uniref:HEAT repeat domain-containing protein n=1 Tax=Hyalangium sp. TaxID=2028555 RepID=UPI002D4A77DB|nr:HEAT repeat domain-containing protein [Hyalangium sp.]HYH94705.1 HEAT repeat domain-containing protein [Hyalangium sp.]